MHFARAAKEHDGLRNTLEGVVLATIDCETEKGKELGRKYKIPGYPTYILINGEEEVVDMWVGYDKPEGWVESLATARSDMSTATEKLARFADQPTLELGETLVRIAGARREYSEVVMYLKTMQRIDPDNATEYAVRIFRSMASGSSREQYTADQVISQGELVVNDSASTPRQLLDVAMTTRAGLERGMLTTEQVVPFMKVAVKACQGIDAQEIKGDLDRLMIDYALYVDQDPDTAVERYKNLLSDGWQQDTQQLNRFAWWCFEKKINLKEAYELALQGVQLAETDNDRANVLDTAAELCNELGDCQQAVELIRQAIEAHPDREYYQKQLERFELLLTEQG